MPPNSVQPTNGILRDFWQFSTPQWNPVSKPNLVSLTCG
jgi:hypothetical protein